MSACNVLDNAGDREDEAGRARDEDDDGEVEDKGGERGVHILHRTHALMAVRP